MNRYDFDPEIMDENNARVERTARARQYPEVDAAEALADIAAELDAILAGYGYGKRDRLLIVDTRGMGLECIEE